jgi:hypothetical protein
MKNIFTISLVFFSITLFLGRPTFAAVPSDRELLTAICDKPEQIIVVGKDSDGAQRLACDTCPTFTTYQGEKQNYELVSKYVGSFSNPGTQEVVTSLKGCEVGANNFGNAVVL